MFLASLNSNPPLPAKQRVRGLTARVHLCPSITTSNPQLAGLPEGLWDSQVSFPFFVTENLKYFAKCPQGLCVCVHFPRGRVVGAVQDSGALGRTGAGCVASPRMLELQWCLHSEEEVVAVPPAPLLLLEVWVTATSSLSLG